ncbi:hypothetical protein FQZ97_1170020 [compost metagenome]
MVPLVEKREQRPFEQRADDQHQRNAQQDREHETAGQAGQTESQVGAHHVEGAMGQVDDPHDAEDQRQATRHQEQQQAVLDRVQHLDQEGIEVHRYPPCQLPTSGSWHEHESNKGV